MSTHKHRLDSSTEELSHEQRVLLSSSKRQEPQGEEHTCKRGHPIVKEKGMSTRETPSPSSISSTTSEEEDDDRRPVKKNSQNTAGPSRKNRNMSLDSNSHSAYNTLIIHQNTSSLLADTWIPASHEFTSVGMGNNRGVTGTGIPASNSGISNNYKSRKSASPSRMANNDEYSQSSQSYNRKTPPNPYENIMSSDQGNNSGNTTSSELSDIPRDYLNQLTVLKHLAKEVQQDPISGTSPGDLFRSASFSRSQPDLTQSVGLSMTPYDTDNNYTSRPEPQQPLPRKSKKQSITRSTNSPTRELKHSQISAGEEVLPSVQILEILMRENSNLKAELVNARRKICTIHKLEAELSRLQASHSALFESAERRESLERSARVKLSSELKRLAAVNRELICSTSLQNLSPSQFSDVEILRTELSNKDIILSQLVGQNKDITATKERQDLELAAQRATLAEQRTHIEILDSALTSAQGNVLRLEEECGKNQNYVEKISNLQRGISSLQLSNEKREQSEKKLRSQLESEITELKLRLASLNANQSPICWNQNQNQNRSCQSPPPYPGAQGLNQNHNSNGRPHDNNESQLKLLQDKLKASEEHISNLNNQVSKWEHVLSPENALRKSSASTPNTPNSWTNSNSRGGTPHFFSGHLSDKTSSDELLSITQTYHRANDLDWKIKELESRLVEKDALIRLLQANCSEKNSSLLSSSMPVMTPPIYRDSPGYSMASTVAASTSSFNRSGSGINNASIDEHYANAHSHNQASQQLYAKLGQKCESEPPNYANLPLKLRLGGSGSSLVKNSNESLSCGGTSPGVSGPGSVSSTSGSGCGKSIDDQLKELDNQLLSKGGTLKIHSGLCCIPGFSHPSAAARKGKISQPLLESLSQGNSTNSVANNPANYSSMTIRGRQQNIPGGILPPLPKPPSTYKTQTHGSQARTSSGPPFISPAALSAMSSMTTTTMSLSNSVDSVLSDPSPLQNTGNVNNSGGNVFAPAVGMPKGLPPKSPAGVLDNLAKSRSLERNKASESCAGKYTVMMYDQTRCRSLDRREAKKEKVEKNSQKIEKSQEKKPEKCGNLKSSVSSKAAFFGQLLSRRSPSPSPRDKEKSNKEKEGQSLEPRRPPLGSKSKDENSKKTEFDVDLDALLLDKQGRSSQSQRNRISSKWSSSNTLESVLEQSGSESPWSQRKSGEAIKSCEEAGLEVQGKSHMQKMEKIDTEDTSKKWGRIVKTPFGLRYTFGSPRIASSDNVGKLK